MITAPRSQTDILWTAESRQQLERSNLTRRANFINDSPDVEPDSPRTEHGEARGKHSEERIHLTHASSQQRRSHSSPSPALVSTLEDDATKVTPQPWQWDEMYNLDEDFETLLNPETLDAHSWWGDVDRW